MFSESAEREERCAEREQRKLEIDQKRHESDLVEVEKVRAHELRLTELNSVAGANGVQNSSNQGNTLFHDLKLPTFNDNQDDINSFLLRFERIAELYQWKRSGYHIYLGSVLRSHVLKVYISLPNDVNNYEKVKDVLLRAYSVDADSFRRKFRVSKCGDKESFAQLVVRMIQYFERRLFLSDVVKDHDSLFDFLVREQLLINCNPDLRAFPKERGFKNSIGIAETADKWKSAHNHYLTKSSKPPQTIKSSQPTPKDRNNTLEFSHGCGKPGHWRPDCPDNP